LDWDLNPRRTTTLGLNNCQLEWDINMGAPTPLNSKQFPTPLPQVALTTSAIVTDNVSRQPVAATQN
jgi:hypothetical protein